MKQEKSLSAFDWLLLVQCVIVLGILLLIAAVISPIIWIGDILTKAVSALKDKISELTDANHKPTY